MEKKDPPFPRRKGYLFDASMFIQPAPLPQHFNCRSVSEPIRLPDFDFPKAPDYTPWLRGSMMLVLVPHEDYLMNAQGMARAQLAAVEANKAIRKMMEAPE